MTRHSCGKFFLLNSTLPTMSTKAQLSQTKYLVANDLDFIYLNAQQPGKDSPDVTTMATSLT